MIEPIVYDLYCGTGGWAEGFLAEGYRVAGYDIEAHDYRHRRLSEPNWSCATCDRFTAPGGDQGRRGTCRFVSQEFSYRAMPWKRAMALPPPHLGMELFNAQFRIRAGIGGRRAPYPDGG